MDGFAAFGSLIIVGVLLINLESAYVWLINVPLVLGSIFIIISLLGLQIELKRIFVEIGLSKSSIIDFDVSFYIFLILIIPAYLLLENMGWLNTWVSILLLLPVVFVLYGFLRSLLGVSSFLFNNNDSDKKVELTLQSLGLVLALIAVVVTVI